MAEKKVIDWESVELQYRAGGKSLKMIGAEFGVSDAGILKRAKRDGWTRDLQAQIRAKADAKVSADAVSAELAPQKALTEKNLIEANAELQARIRREQRTDITRSRKLVMSLLSELEHQTDNLDLLRQLGELMHAPDEKGVDKLGELYQKMISLGSRTGTMKSLADSLKSLVALEREAFGIDGKYEDPDEKKALAAVDPQDLARRVAFMLAKAINQGT